MIPKLFLMEELIKDQNNLYTYKQILNTRLECYRKQFFNRQIYFQYSTKLFLLCSVRTVIKLCKYQNTSSVNYKDQWATNRRVWQTYTFNFHNHHLATTLSSGNLLWIFYVDILKEDFLPFYHHSPYCNS